MDYDIIKFLVFVIILLFITLVHLINYNQQQDHYNIGGIFPFLASIIATVFPWEFYIDGSWYHSSKSSMPFIAKHIATVLFEESYKEGSWCHFSGGIILLTANIYATVFLLLFYNSGSWNH